MFSYIRKFYDGLIKNWFLTATLLVLPSYYFIILQFYGNQLGLISINNTLTTLGSWLLWSLIIFSIVINYSKSKGDKYIATAQENTKDILRKLISNTNTLAQSKYNRFIKYIEENHSKKISDPFNQITKAERQISLLLNNLRDIFADSFKIDADDIGISIIYNSKLKPLWKWLHKINIENDLSKKELISNPNSSVRQIIDGHCKTIFELDKREAIKKNIYAPSHKDEEHDNIGSVICKKLYIGDDPEYLTAILSITTYGIMICKKRDFDYSKKVINDVLLKSFEKRLLIELSLLTIKEMYDQSLKKNKS